MTVASDRGTFLEYITACSLIHPFHPLDRSRFYWSRNLISQFNCPIELSRNVSQSVSGEIRENFGTVDAAALWNLIPVSDWERVNGISCPSWGSCNVELNRSAAEGARFSKMRSWLYIKLVQERSFSISFLIRTSSSIFFKGKGIRVWLHKNFCSSRIIAKFPPWC